RAVVLVADDRGPETEDVGARALDRLHCGKLVDQAVFVDDVEGERVAVARLDRVPDLVERPRGGAVDPDDRVAGLQTGLCGGCALLDRVDAPRGRGRAPDHVDDR